MKTINMYERSPELLATAIERYLNEIRDGSEVVSVAWTQDHEKLWHALIVLKAPSQNG